MFFMKLEIGSGNSIIFRLFHVYSYPIAKIFRGITGGKFTKTRKDKVKVIPITVYIYI